MEFNFGKIPNFLYGISASGATSQIAERKKGLNNDVLFLFPGGEEIFDER